jgi:hypothetical protein
LPIATASQCRSFGTTETARATQSTVGSTGFERYGLFSPVELICIRRSTGTNSSSPESKVEEV